MLGGLAPLLIFNFAVTPKSPVFNALSGIPLIGPSVAANIGVPIPIYMDEELTGIVVESETRAIDIDTVIQARNDGGPPLTDQRGLNSLVTVNMIGSKDSILLNVLLAMSDLIVQKIVSKEYKVSYSNGPTTVIGGLLHGLSTSTTSDDDLIRIVLQIQKPPVNATVPNNVTSVLPKITGATPVVGA